MSDKAKKTKILVNEWKPYNPSRGVISTLKFTHAHISIAQDDALVELHFIDKDKEDLWREIVGPTEDVYTTSLTYIPRNEVIKFSRIFDEKRINSVVDKLLMKEPMRAIRDAIKVPPAPTTRKEIEEFMKQDSLSGNAQKEINRMKEHQEVVTARRLNKTLQKYISKVFYAKNKQSTLKEEEDKKIKKLLGIYGYKTPGEMLADRIAQTGITTTELAKIHGFADTSMIQKHIKGHREISRDQAVIYAKVFGCDPADILFPAPQIPMWGTVDFLRFHEHAFDARDPLEVTLPWSPGEIYPDTNLPSVLVPRDIYRPDIKAIKVVSKGSSLNENVLFYYSTNNIEQDCLNKLSIVGTLETSLDGSGDHRYYVGIFESHRGKTRLINPDPFGKEHLDNDPNNPRNESAKKHPDRNYKPDNENVIGPNEVIDFATPIVAMINPEKIKQDKYSAELFKKSSEVYEATRITERQQRLGAQLRYYDETAKLEDKQKKLYQRIEKEREKLMDQLYHINNQIGLIPKQGSGEEKVVDLYSIKKVNEQKKIN